MIRVVLSLLTLALVATLAPAGAQQDKAPSVDDLVKQFDGGKDFYRTLYALSAQLDKRDRAAEELAGQLLKKKEAFVSDAEAVKFVDGVTAKESPAVAAELLLRIAQARRAVQESKKGHVILGQLVVADGKLSPELVMAQMPILPEGYFAGEVGDLERPVGFRAHGYGVLDVSLKGKTGDVIPVGRLTLKPIAKDEAATLKGKVVLDGAKTAAGVEANLSTGVPPPNTPHNGYSPRRRWPEGIKVKVEPTGEFEVRGLSPCNYYLQVTADKHVSQGKQVTLKPGKVNDLAALRLTCTDLGFYIGKPAPKTEALTWEKNYASALKRARQDKKPLLVMMTATWCGPCKKLEKETLDDPWVRHFLSSFVLVKAYEEKEVEERYGCDGYPTLVFTDTDGKAAHKTVGYQPAMTFTAECARAYKKLALKTPPDLQMLIEKKVVAQ